MRLLIDGDYLIYNSGFAGEHNFYCVTSGHDDPYLTRTFKDKTSANAQMEAWLKEGFDNAIIWHRTELEPIEYVLHTVKKQLETMVRKTAQRTKTKEDALDVELYLTGSGNYRERVATIAPYKGNRDPRHKPVYMRQVQEYLRNVWSATTIFGIEADDEVSICQSEDRDAVCVAGIDKDLLQVPGLHYVPKKGFKNIGERSGILRFYWQVLHGDTTDNINGCYKLGKAGALKIVKRVAAETDSSVDSLDAVLWLETLNQYKKSMEKYGDDIYGGLTYEEAARENAILVYMLRERPKDYFRPTLWEPPI